MSRSDSSCSPTPDSDDSEHRLHDSCTLIEDDDDEDDSRYPGRPASSRSSDSSRSVRFSVVEEFEYDKPDYTEEEIARLWYTMEEMVGLVKYELQLCEDNNKKAGRCWRGLEHMKGGVDNRAERVSEICDSILDAYDELSYDSDKYKTEDDQAEALRAECRALTKDDRKRAHKYGLRDATTAEGIFRDDDAENKKSSSSNSKGRSSSDRKSKSQGGRKPRKPSPRDKRRVKRSRSHHGDTEAPAEQRQRSQTPERPVGVREASRPQPVCVA